MLRFLDAVGKSTIPLPFHLVRPVQLTPTTMPVMKTESSRALLQFPGSDPTGFKPSVDMHFWYNCRCSLHCGNHFLNKYVSVPNQYFHHPSFPSQNFKTGRFILICSFKTFHNMKIQTSEQTKA